jgi:hypothetical protein
LRHCCWLAGDGEKALDAPSCQQRANRVVEQYQRILGQQDALVQTLVETMAAVCECGNSGYECNGALLQIVLCQPCKDTIAHAIECGLLQANRQENLGVSAFNAAVSLIPELQRALVHLKIGRRLWRAYQNTHNDNELSVLFLIGRQLQQSLGVVSDVHELGVVAMIQMRAGRYAAGASKFMMAANFFERGIDALGSTPWKDKTYEISLNLHNSCAEAYYCVGSFVLLDAVFENTRSFHDKLQAYATLVYANASRNRLMEALTMTFDVLKDLDEPMPAAPGMLTISCQYLKTARMLHGKPDDFFLRQPTATDSTKVATMTMLSFAFFSAIP